jgi:transcriptional regulator with XRE-family HTH domain
MQHCGMAKPKSLTAQLHEVGLSQPYASQVANGKRRPGMETALTIYRKLGIALGPLAGKSKADIATLAKAQQITSAT